MDMEKKYVVVKDGVRVSNAMPLSEAQAFADKIRLTESTSTPQGSGTTVQIVEFLLG